MAITTTTARADIFKEVYSVVSGSITTSGVKVTNAFVNSRAELPQVVIGAPMLPRKREHFGTASTAYNRSGEIDIDIYGQTMKECVELIDDVENAIFSNLGSISVQNVQVGDSDFATIEVGGKNTYVMTIPLAFQFRR